jgi:hypothetical protein
MPTSDHLIDAYLDWLREHSTEQDVDDGWKALTFPFLDRHNDHLQVFVRQGPDGIEITDDGTVVRDLSHRATDPLSSLHEAEAILKELGLDVILDTTEIRTVAREDQFPRTLHTLLNAMLAIDGLDR